MVNIVKKLAHIAFQKIALAAILPKMLMHESIQPVHGKQRSLLFAARCVIVNQMLFKVWSQQISAQTVLHNSIPIMQRIDFAHFRVVNRKMIISRQFVCAVCQFFLNLTQIRADAHFKLNNITCSTFAFSRSQIRTIQVLKITDFFIIKFHRSSYKGRSEDARIENPRIPKAYVRKAVCFIRRPGLRRHVFPRALPLVGSTATV